ncbi:hypothetical protein WR25_04271 [Diploscapter pachys]|uniref:Flippase-like domain-containing protein n=1 Tax=Diploscapter pachys TaxID=2018661 RepID=A0A2A2KKL6_9BILA|nr:hypothetical protein WR25_04271 [Diploscapter pachys]
MMLLLGMILLCWAINAIRLRLLLGEQGAQVGRMRSLGVIIATEFAICTTPGGTGGPLTLMTLLARERIAPSRSGAVFAMDQLNDLLFFFCAMLAIAAYALFHRLGQSQAHMLMGSALLLCIALTVIVLLVRYRHAVMRGNGRLLRRLGVTSQRRLRWARKVLRFAHALADTLRMPRRRLAAVFFLTCAHWCLRYSVLYLVLRGRGDPHLARGYLLLLPAGRGAGIPLSAGASTAGSSAPTGGLSRLQSSAAPANSVPSSSLNASGSKRARQPSPKVGGAEAPALSRGSAICRPRVS